MSRSFAHLLHMGLLMGQRLVNFGISGIQIFRNPYLWNHWTYFLCSKYYGIFENYMYAMSWSFAHLPHMGLPMAIGQWPLTCIVSIIIQKGIKWFNPIFSELIQFPTCGSRKRLPILWFMGWGTSSFANPRNLLFLLTGPDKNINGCGGHFKNTYELLNLRALKFSPLNEIYLSQCKGKIFCVEFQRYHLKVHSKYLTHTLKDMIFIQH